MARRLQGAGTFFGCLLPALFVLTVAPRTSHAEQFVLFDATFRYTWDDAMNSSPSKSHYYVTESNWLNKARPTNWTSPVNYRDGTVHIHVEVLEKPAGTQQVGWGLCYIANSGGYGCPYTPYYTQTGVYERDVGMRDFWNNNTINWGQGIKQVDLVYTINDSGSGHITNYPNLKDLTTPTRVRIALVQVSSGAKYDPSILPALDGGAPGGTKDGGAASEAGLADGANGSGGALGSGGSGGENTGGAGEGGTGGTGGTSGQGSGGTSTSTVGTGGVGTSSGAGSNDDIGGGCSCSVAKRDHALSAFYGWAAAALCASWANRRRRR